MAYVKLIQGSRNLSDIIIGLKNAKFTGMIEVGKDPFIKAPLFMASYIGENGVSLNLIGTDFVMDGGTALKGTIRKVTFTINGRSLAIIDNIEKDAPTLQKTVNEKGWVDGFIYNIFAGNDQVVGSKKMDNVFGITGDDELWGKGGHDTIYGFDGNDTGYGGGGDDFIHGGKGNDNLYGGKGDDKLEGAEGADKIFGNSGNDDLYGKNGSDTLKGGAGHDEIWASKGNDKLSGGSGHDIVSGEAGRDMLDGGKGDDSLYGGTGNDKAKGGAGDDTVAGNNGDDFLHGGAGQDQLWGGKGADVFVFTKLSDSTPTDPDLIADFRLSQKDKIDLSAIDADKNKKGNQAFSFIGEKEFSGIAGELNYEVKKGDVYIYGDVNGDGEADLAIKFDYVGPLSANLKDPAFIL